MTGEPPPGLAATGPEQPEATTPPVPATTPESAARVGDYVLLNEVAHGGMGVVYRARHARLGRVVALKMILAGPRAGPTELRRFREEAEAAAHLDHPGIVPVYDFGEHHGRPYFTMAFIEGQSLAARLARGPLENAVAAGVVRAAATAVQFAHEHGVIHRDLKPGNVLLDKDGTVKVTDFGLARRIRPEDIDEDPDDTGAAPPSPDAEHQGAEPGDFATDVGEISTTPPSPTAEELRRLTRTGAVMGTPSYMAPEQVADAKRVGPAADVWALGAMLYALLTGRPPFLGANLRETLRLVVEAEPVPPRSLNPAIDRDLETVCLKCLQKDPAARYASAAELADDLGRYQAGQPLRARPPGRLEGVLRSIEANPAVLPFLGGLVTLRLLGAPQGLFVGAALAALRLPFRPLSRMSMLLLGAVGILTPAAMALLAGAAMDQNVSSVNLVLACICGGTLGMLAAAGRAALTAQQRSAGRAGRAFGTSLVVVAVGVALVLPLLGGVRLWLRASPEADAPAVGGLLLLVIRILVWVLSLAAGAVVVFFLAKVGQTFHRAVEGRMDFAVALPGCLTVAFIGGFVIWLIRWAAATNSEIAQNWNSAAISARAGMAARWGSVVGTLAEALAHAFSWLAALLLGLSAGALLGWLRGRAAVLRPGDTRSTATAFTLGATVAVLCVAVLLWLALPAAEAEDFKAAAPADDAGSALEAILAPGWESPLQWAAVALTWVALLAVPLAVGGLIGIFLVSGIWHRKSPVRA
jgi:serine/threonine-protein kinase